jgi:hypothetical protein
MPKVAPLCLNCGREPVRILLDPSGFSIVLRKISEKQEVLGPFLATLRLLSTGPVGDLKFIIGDARMYSRAEQKTGIKIPVRIADGVHASSLDEVLEVLGGATNEIRISAHPADKSGRFKRGPLISLREGRVVPEKTVALVRTLSQSRTKDEKATKTLSEQCQYALSLAAATLASDPATRPLADEDHLSPLWQNMQKAVDTLDSTFAFLAGTNLQEAYADLERLDLEVTNASDSPGRSSATRQKEKQRVQKLFRDHADTERRAAELEQRIVAACRILEDLDTSQAANQLLAVEKLVTN